MKVEMLPSTKIACRISFSLALCLIIIAIFPIVHPMWLIMVSVMVFSGSIGSSVRLALARTLMTILGCLLGAGLYLLVDDNLVWEFTFGIIASFLMVYFMPVSNVLMNFFLGVIFVLSLAIFHLFSLYNLQDRLTDVLAGTVCALIGALVVFPERSKETIKKYAVDNLEQCDLFFKWFLAAYRNHRRDEQLGPKEQGFPLSNEKEFEKRTSELNTAMSSALASLQDAKYEMPFSKFPYRKYEALILCQQKIGDILESMSVFVAHPAPKPYLDLNVEIRELFEKIEQAFILLKEALNAEKPEKKELPSIEPIRERVLEKLKQTPPHDDEALKCWMNFRGLCHYLFLLYSYQGSFMRLL